MIEVAMVLVAVTVGFAALRPRLLASPMWRATVTPLASIIGSGFLVAGPIISHAAGDWAWLAMAGLCAIAWAFGATIRHNIGHLEPQLAKGDAAPHLLALERISELALAFAYFISVAYYLNLFGAFGLRGVGVIDATYTRWLASIVIGCLGLIGLLRGLRWLEHIEIFVVGLKLAMIGAVITALAFAAGGRLAAGASLLGNAAPLPTSQSAPILLGLVILVQGFETSRYLGHAYDARTRIRSMRHAQLLSTAIYIVFIALMTPWFTGRLAPTGGETAIIDMLRPLSVLLAPAIIVTALASQLSAGIADMNGAGGLIDNVSRHRISDKIGYLATAAAAIAITWSANIFEIIAYASKAFVFYYAVQSGTAALVALPRSGVKSAAFGLLALFGLAIVIFGAPAEGN